MGRFKTASSGTRGINEVIVKAPIKRDTKMAGAHPLALARRGNLLSTTALNPRFLPVAAFAIGASIVGVSGALALPQDGAVASGDATIVLDSATQMTVNQASSKIIIDWRSFSIGADELVHFQQPIGGLAVNRVTGSDPSYIFGQLTSTGSIMLLNGNGVLFGVGSRVDVGSLVASTINISNARILADDFRFDQLSNSNSMVINRGQITAAEGGLVAMVAPGVENSGVIQARLGKVSLAAGKSFTLDMYGDGLVQLSVDSTVVDQITDLDSNPLQSLVKNSGTIQADGGTVLLTARAAQGVVDSVINMDGLIQAQSVAEINGEILLMGGEEGILELAGGLDASGTDSGETGGTVKVLGEKVGLFDGASIDVSGDAGGGEVLIGGNYKGGGPEQNAANTYVSANATINADAITDGDGGRVIVWSDETTRIYGSISARGGSVSGDGGFVETSSKGYLDITSAPDVGASTGSGGYWLIDPSNI